MTLNPLSVLLLQKFGINLEFLPGRHHAFIVNPYYARHELCIYSCRERAVGGSEVGYRYYTGRRGPNDVFIGTSAVLETTERGLNYGLIVDVGAQEVTSAGFVVGAGAGLLVMRLAGETIVVPRALFTIGWAF